jgi:putative lipoprotein
MRRTPLALALSLSAAAVHAQPVVTGEAFWRERIATPPGAVFEAVLADTARADAPAFELGRARIEPAGNPPIGFEIPYDPDALDDRMRVTVRATVTVDGRLWMTSDTVIPALTGGAGDRVTVPMRMAQAQPPAPLAAEALTLQGTRWRLEAVGEMTNPPDGTAELIFGPDGGLSGSGGCNRIVGSYVARSDGAFLASDLASTMMACPEPAMAIEQSLHGALRVARGWGIEGDRLTLSAEGAPIATFRGTAP